MLRRLLFALLASLLLGNPLTLALAQGPPGAHGPAVSPPADQRPTTNPGTSPHVQRPPPADLPPEVLNAPYGGPSPRPIPQIQTRQDVENPANRAAMQAANDAARPRLEVYQRLQNRVRGGDHTTLPTAEETRALDAPRFPGVAPRPAPRSEERGPWNLLGFLDNIGVFLPDPASSPDPSPDEQAWGTCPTYAWMWQNYDPQWNADYLWAEGLQICGVVNVSDIRSMQMSLHLFRCGFYFSWFNYCLGVRFYDELLPACYQGPGTNVQWCAPRVYYPWEGGGYFLRVYSYAEYWQGGWTSNQTDSAIVSFHCPGAWCS